MPVRLTNIIAREGKLYGVLPPVYILLSIPFLQKIKTRGILFSMGQHSHGIHNKFYFLEKIKINYKLRSDICNLGNIFFRIRGNEFVLDIFIEIVFCYASSTETDSWFAIADGDTKVGCFTSTCSCP